MSVVTREKTALFSYFTKKNDSLILLIFDIKQLVVGQSLINLQLVVPISLNGES